MPELPELDVLRENLEARLRGRVVRSARADSPAVLKTYEPPLTAIDGQRISGSGRRGKYVWLELAPAGAATIRGERNGQRYLVLHLSLGGRLSLAPKPPRRPALRIELDDGSVLALTEGGTERRAAVWLLDELSALDRFEQLGPEPLDPDFTPERLAAILGQGGHTLKGVLTDQRMIAGVGNAWSDDALHRARLSPFARPERLDTQQVDRLHAALVGVLTEARGALAEQARGEVTVPRAGDRLFAVHGRAGAACFACGDTIRSVWLGERETSYCPSCQTGGRVLADRRRSRFLR